MEECCEQHDDANADACVSELAADHAAYSRDDNDRFGLCRRGLDCAAMQTAAVASFKALLDGLSTMRNVAWQIRGQGEESKLVVFGDDNGTVDCTRFDECRELPWCLYQAGSVRSLSRLACDFASCCVFGDVQVSMALPRDMLLVADGYEIVDPRYLSSKSNGSCLVYALGIADTSALERAMAQHCDVLAFDCTVPPSADAVRDAPFIFHQICIGEPASQRPEDTFYGWKASSSPSDRFRRLDDIMAEFGHTHLDILKFDIEGGEWALLEQHILLSRGFRPTQLVFELHTEGANPNFVERRLSQFKNARRVNLLFAQLHALGYRLVTQQPGSDVACKQFTLVYAPLLFRDSSIGIIDEITNRYLIEGLVPANVAQP